MVSQNRCSSAIRVCNRSRESCSPQMAVPRTLMPSGCQASRPNGVHQDIRLLLCSTPSSFPGGGECPPLATDTVCHKSFSPVPGGRVYTSSEKHTTALQAGGWQQPSSNAHGMPMENKSGIRGSPCSPPSACTTVRFCPSSSHQLHGQKNGVAGARKRKDSANSRRRQSSVAALRAWPCAPMPSTLSMVAWVTRIERAHTHLQNQKQITLRASRRELPVAMPLTLPSGFANAVSRAPMSAAVIDAWAKPVTAPKSRPNVSGSSDTTLRCS